MKMLTLELDDKVYEAVVAQAQRTGRSPAEVLQETIAALPQFPQFRDRGEGSHSYRDIKPLGLHPKPDALNFDNLWDEMIDDSDRD
ncbi:MAG: hypothetical protein ACKV2Q_22460 [Planctomycetaceae bacterium]